MEEKLIEVYVSLLDEGTFVVRPTFAEDIGEGLYKLLPSKGYDPQNENWEFLPNSIVKIKPWTNTDGKTVMLAYKI